MKKIRCLIIEDEFPAVEILKSYISKVDNWEILAAFDNALDAISFLSKNSVDVLFLDIQLPELNGMDFIKSVENHPLIVITSAYSEHAVEAYELAVFDYLLKPYSFQRFIKSVARINDVFEQGKNEITDSTIDFLTVKEKRKNVNVYLKDIIFIESQKEYVRIVCENNEIKTKTSLSKLEKELLDFNFIRIHRSFLVSIEKITTHTKKEVFINNHKIPIGK